LPIKPISFTQKLPIRAMCSVPIIFRRFAVKVQAYMFLLLVYFFGRLLHFAVGIKGKNAQKFPLWCHVE